jgi:hypothetical protein
MLLLLLLLRHSQSSTSQRSCTLPWRTKRLHAPSLSSAWQQQQQQRRQQQQQRHLSATLLLQVCYATLTHISKPHAVYAAWQGKGGGVSSL